MAINNFKPFAISPTATVLTQAEYEARAALINQGFQVGIADPEEANKVWRQSTAMNAALGEFIKGQGLDALDDGNIAALSDAFRDSLLKTVQPGDFIFATAAGTGNALVVTLDPPLTALTPGLAVRVYLTAPNTGDATININGLGPAPIKRLGGTDLQASDLFTGAIADLVYAGGVFQILGLANSTTPPRSQWVRSVAGSYVFVVPSGIYKIFGRVCGGGGGGGGVAKTAGGATQAAGAGGAGGYAEGWVDVTPGQSITITVGLGGAGGLPSNGSPGVSGASGLAGGTSSFGAFMSATGGGYGVSIPPAGGPGGSGSGGTLTTFGGDGTDGPPGGGIYGGNGGASAFGGGQRAGTRNPGGLKAKAPGSGGGAVYDTYQAGEAGRGFGGADGIVILQW